MATPHRPPEDSFLWRNPLPTQLEAGECPFCYDKGKKAIVQVDTDNDITIIRCEKCGTVYQHGEL
jgi:transcription elongation factor Elf1